MSNTLGARSLHCDKVCVHTNQTKLPKARIETYYLGALKKEKEKGEFICLVQEEKKFNLIYYIFKFISLFILKS